MTPSAKATASKGSHPNAHRGPLEWRMLLNWLAEDGILTPQDVDTVMQRFAAGTSAQHPLVRLASLGLKRADTGTALELEPLTEWLAQRVKLPYLRNTIIPLGQPQRGDIAVFIYPEDKSKDFIKRVIAVGGDTVEVRNKKVFINGEPMDDPHGVHVEDVIYPKSIQRRDNMGPVKVPEGAIFVMGDNRDQSYDSRFWGFVKLEDVIGKAFIIYFSWDSDNSGVRWNRIGKLLE